VTVQPELIPALTAEERSRLAELERVIERDLGTFVEVGVALRTVRDEGLYRDAHPPTFEAYLRQRWGMGRSNGYELMDAAQVAEAAMSGAPDIPIPSVTVARQLVPFLDREADEQPEVVKVWQAIIPTLVGRPVTAERVRQALVAVGYVPDDRYRQATGGRPNRAVLLGQFGDRLAAAQARLVRFVDRELGEQALAQSVRPTAARYRAWATGMAAVLDLLATGQPVPRGEELYRLLGMEEL
jgi:hypothetical protein